MPERRYWVGACGFVFLMLALIVVLAVRGSTVEVGVSTSPTPGAVVSGRSRIVLTFPAAMRRESVETRLAVVAAQGDTAVPGSWSWEDGGLRSERVAQFIPATPLVPEMSYRATLRGGAQATNGRSVSRNLSWTFAVRAASLLFVRTTPDAPTPQLWGADAIGGNLRRITNEPGGVLEFSPAPDGSRIAYTTREGPQLTALRVIGADGTGRARLSPTGDPSGYASPAWSPAGDVIAYVLRAYVSPTGIPGDTSATGTTGTATLGNPKIWAATPGGTSLGRVYGRGDEVGTAPAWSPDGTRLALREQVDEQHTAVVLSDLSPNPAKVAAGPGGRIAWSPDGKRAAYDETLAGPGGAIQSRVVVVAADGTGSRLLFAGASGAEATPDWSPDGRHLAYTRRVRAAGGSTTTEVWTAATDGTDPRRLLGGDGLAATDPAWSPDGRSLIATRFNPRTSDDRGLWSVAADGSGAKLLVAGGEHVVWVP